MEIKSASAVVIIPKEPFVKWANWANSISGFGREQSMDYFTSDCTVVLIPKFLSEKEAREYTLTIWEDIFEKQLERYIDKPLWPQEKTKEMFSKWFGIKFHSVVFTCLLADN